MNGLAFEQSTIAGTQGPLALARWTPATVRNPAPLILLHDSLGCIALWRDFPERLALACERPVVAYDRTGFGHSAVHPGQLSMNFIAEEAAGDFAAVLRHLDMPRFAVFGHSVGGGMAVHCAARYATQCEALITESAQAFVEDRTIAGIEAARDAFADASQRSRLARYHGDKTPWVLDAWINTWLDPAFAGWTLQAALPQLQCPVLAIHGDQDEYASLAHPQMIAGQTGRMEILSGVGHVPHREDSGRVVELVTRHLSWLA